MVTTADCSQTNDRMMENGHCRQIRDEEEMEEVSSVEILKQMSDVHSDDEEDSGEI